MTSSIVSCYPSMTTTRSELEEYRSQSLPTLSNDSIASLSHPRSHTLTKSYKSAVVIRTSTTQVVSSTLVQSPIMDSSNSNFPGPSIPQTPMSASNAGSGPQKKEVLVGTPVKEGHVNYMLMYDMLTGIRISVSRCNSKPPRDVTLDDYTAAHKIAFDMFVL